MSSILLQQSCGGEVCRHWLGRLGILVDVPDKSSAIGLGGSKADLCIGLRWFGSFWLVLVPEDCADRRNPQAGTLCAASHLQLALCWQEEDVALAGRHGSLKVAIHQ